jgi:hypothetical protein
MNLVESIAPYVRSPLESSRGRIKSKRVRIIRSSTLSVSSDSVTHVPDFITLVIENDTHTIEAKDGAK